VCEGRATTTFGSTRALAVCEETDGAGPNKLFVCAKHDPAVCDKIDGVGPSELHVDSDRDLAACGRINDLNVGVCDNTLPG
jgi:hypothetical protein